MKLPSPLRWRYRTLREYKAEMRQRAYRVRKLVRDQLVLGSAFSPAYFEICEIRRLIDKAIEKQSVQNWGR